MTDEKSLEILAEPATGRQIPCFACGTDSVHRVLAAANESGYAEEADIQWATRHEIVQCQGRRRISFRQDSQNPDDGYPNAKGEWVTEHHVKLYPARVPGREALQHLHYLPWQVQRIYSETHGVIVHELPILAGIGVRAIVESVCKEQQASGTNLEAKIDDLVTMEVLTKDGAETLYGTRLLGNKAAHEQEPVPNAILNAAVEVVEHLLKTVFIFPNIAKNLPRRGQANGGVSAQCPSPALALGVSAADTVG